MRCPDCNKFVSLSTDNDPEVDGLEIDEEGHIGGTVRVVLTCGECGQEMKEANFDIQYEVDAAVIEGHADDPKAGDPAHELSVDGDGSITEEMPVGKNGKHKTSGPADIGYSLSVDIMCKCQKDALASVDIADSMPANEFDELV